MVPMSDEQRVRIERLRDKSALVLEAGEDSDFVVSPCIAVCDMDASTGLCLGCYRSLEEIARWSRSTPGVKRQVWQTLLDRLPT